jgi:hypothetical protein
VVKSNPGRHNRPKNSSHITKTYIGGPSNRVTALYFYGSILLRALKSKITVILTYAKKDIVDLVNM